MKCDGCDELPPVHGCMPCYSNYCGACWDRRYRKPPHVKHERADVRDFSLMVCTHHGEELVEYVCVEPTCKLKNELACACCVREEGVHHNHTVIAVGDAYTRFVGDLTTKLGGLSSNIENAKSKQDDYLVRDSKRNAYENSVNERCNTLIARIKKRRAFSMRNVADYTEKWTHKCTVEQQRLSEATDLASTMQAMRERTQSNRDVEFIRDYRDIERRAVAVDARLRASTRNIEPYLGDGIGKDPDSEDTYKIRLSSFSAIKKNTLRAGVWQHKGHSWHLVFDLEAMTETLVMTLYCHFPVVHAKTAKFEQTCIVTINHPFFPWMNVKTRSTTSFSPTNNLQQLSTSLSINDICDDEYGYLIADILFVEVELK